MFSSLELFDYLYVWNGFTTLSVVLLVIGIALLIAEFFMPGFGVCGILGILCLTADIFLTARSVTEGLLMFLGVIAIVVLMLVLFVHFSAKGKMLRGMILGTTTSSELGYNSTRDFSSLIGYGGHALTPLRPAGEVEIGGQRYDVVTQGEYLPKGSDVYVVETEGNRIVVQAVVS
ncbi:MAG: serine protease [Oscillospiraceae bacterium]|jgi:membrane-bound ClpP family serine protease|nr:serine protease [Oscillospiraceae bacterium]